MKYLLVCNHRKSIVESHDPLYDVRMSHKCPSCVHFELATSKWSFKDVRVYEATEEDCAAIGIGKHATVVKHKATPEQLDWVGK